MNRSTQHAFEPEEIMAYLDGELEAQQAAALASHLDHCVECQAVAAQLRQVSERLLDFQIEPCPPKAIESVLAATERNGGSTVASRVEVESRRRRGLRILAWASTCAIVLLLSLAVAVPHLLRSKMAANEDTPASRERGRLAELIQQRAEQSAAQGSVDNARLPTAPPPPSGTGELSRLEVFGKLETPPSNALLPQSQAVSNGPMIVQTASISILAQNYEQASGQLQPLTAQRGGYVQDMTADTRTGAARSVSATLRVSEKQLESFLGDLRKLGHVEQETRNNQEVTDAYIDLRARLKTARATEQRIVQLLGTRTGKLSDVLEAEQELARIRGDIESMDGQRAHMEHQVSYATVQVQLNEEYREQLNPESHSTGRRLRNSLVEGLGKLTGGIIALALFVFAYGPSIVFWLGLLAVPAWFIYRRVKKPRKTNESL